MPNGAKGHSQDLLQINTSIEHSQPSSTVVFLRSLDEKGFSALKEHASTIAFNGAPAVNQLSKTLKNKDR
jgi:hypothetical protein